jgi:nucleoside-diphosphate-sugar epimerase
MAQYLVTGAAGFIGSALVRALLERGESVRAFDNFETGKRDHIQEVAGQIDFKEADLLDPQAMRSACEGVDYVLHQAAIPSVPRSIADPARSNRVNVEGTLNLLIAARDAGVKRVVYAASSSAYGDTPTLPKHENMPPNPISPYAVSKLAGELYMTSFYRVYGLPTVSLRYFNVFGPRQDANSQYSAVLAKFITSMLQGEKPVIHGDGEQSRDFTYIDNVVAANLLAATRPGSQVAGQIFNIATGHRFTLNETFAILKELTEYSDEVVHVPTRAGDVQHSLADVSRAEKQLGYRPLVSFKEGLRRTVAWYRSRVAVTAAGARR